MLMRILRCLLRRKPKPPRIRDIVIEVMEPGARHWKVESYNSDVTRWEAERRAWETLDANRDRYDKARLVDEHSGDVIIELAFGKGGSTE